MQLAKAKSLIRIDPQLAVSGLGHGWFNPGLVGIEARNESDLQHFGIHELQHMIDYLEGLARGGSKAEFTKLGFSPAEAEDMYNRLMGEVVARNAQTRLGLDEAYRKRWSPLSTERLIEATPRDQQTIRPYSDLFGS